MQASSFLYLQLLKFVLVSSLRNRGKPNERVSIVHRVHTYIFSGTVHVALSDDSYRNLPGL